MYETSVMCHRQTRDGCSSIHIVICTSKVQSSVIRLTSVVRSLVFDKDERTIDDHFNYLDSYTMKNGGTAVEMSTGIAGTRAVYAGLGHLWRHLGI